MTNVAQVIQDKAEQAIYTVSPDATVLEAISIMAEKGIGALVSLKIMKSLESCLSAITPAKLP